MIRPILILLAIAVALPAAAFDLGNHAPAKPAGTPGAPPPADPDTPRQGGDTILDAVRIPIPTVDLAGTTAPYVDDYDEVCPYTYSNAHDVVYSVVPEADLGVNVDMWGSSYDTKVYIYDQNLALIACNDDYYSDYTSFLEDVPLEGGMEYFVVVDGYVGAWGDYLIDVVEYEPCVLACPPGAVTEDEPPLTDDYQDAYNGGCNSPEFGYPFGIIDSELFCGVSGWYLDGGIDTRDTDWFTIEVPGSGVLEITGDAEFASYMFELGPQDCDNVGVLQNVTIGPCTEATLTITGDPGSTVWFWVGPTTFTSPDYPFAYEFDYVLVTNLAPVATESHSWTGVKALFD